FQLKIRGNIHQDLRLFQGQEPGSPASIDIRRARVDLQGRLYRVFTFRLQPELAGNPYIRNAWFDIEAFSWLHLRLGQMKVPFSSSWLTRDNNLDFIERGSSSPIYPFFDRGLIVWGDIGQGSLFYNVGVFTGVGVDRDVKSGDIDDSKDIAGRLFIQPFVTTDAKPAKGLIFVVEGTWGAMSVPTSRYELGGLRGANYEAALWKWRTEQEIGSDGRVSDVVAATVSRRYRWGVEAHYLLGPWALSAEYLELHYLGIAPHHDLYVGSSRKVHELLFEQDGAMRSFSVFTSLFLTGEHKQLTNGGWKTAKPKNNLGRGGAGAVEVLLRYSRNWADKELFESVSVPGYDALPEDISGAPPGAENSVTVSVLSGAHNVHELSAGLSWTINPMVRIQLNDVFLWAPISDRNGDGQNDNLMLSGAKSDQSNPDLKGIGTSWENAIMSRVIFKI
ncbi:MAG: hypothetical protein HN348_20525, partial [Proteobacteria bacterium]|nr:hypothetical protein [Pseudomonadota bacterium]